MNNFKRKHERDKGDTFKDDTKISFEKIIQATIIYSFDSVPRLVDE